jgi:hypothetical protein
VPTVTVDDVAPHVKQITLNRPERLNALNFELTADLHGALGAVGADAECRVPSSPARSWLLFGPRPQGLRHAARPGEHPHVHAGIGGQEFMANLTVHLRRRRRSSSPGERRRRRWAGDRAAADLRIAGASATFCSAFIRTGLTGTDIGVSYTLPRLSARRAFDLIVTGRTSARSKPDTSGSSPVGRRRVARRGDRARVGIAYRGRLRMTKEACGPTSTPRTWARRSRSRTATRRSPPHPRSGLHGRVHGTPSRKLEDTMARHPFHEVVISGVYNTQQARARGHDSRSITFDARSRARRRRGVVRDVDGVIGATAASSCTSRGSVRCGGRCRGWASAIIETAGAIANGLATTVLIAAGSAGVYTDRVDRPWTVPRTSSSRRSACSLRPSSRHGPSPHAPLRHHARGDGHRRRRHPQQRPRQPEAVYRSAAVHRQDILDSRMVADPTSSTAR